MHGTHEAFELFKNFGGDSFSIASVFLMSGLFPSLLMAYPNYSTCLHADSHVSNDTARFSASSFSKTVCSFCRCNSIDPFVTINMSSRYTRKLHYF